MRKLLIGLCVSVSMLVATPVVNIDSNNYSSGIELSSEESDDETGG